jgi:hypothetical protein
VVQVAECLPTKCEALSSNSSTEGGREKEEREGGRKEGTEEKRKNLLDYDYCWFKIYKVYDLGQISLCLISTPIK